MKCEVLAPAGSIDALIAAVRCGADAVYLGGGSFNARRGAANFATAQQLKEAVDFCHCRGVKVYLTLNTLVSDREIPAALDQLKAACDAGIDAVIVQDLGLARLIKKAAPSLNMHASTQMSVHSASALPLLKGLGFCRVVLSRELSREQMTDICRAADELGIEIEVFVHGALCMCLSGQCYMSGVIGRRSGNRGMCAQPCRMPFADGSYPLSLKDMSLLDEVAQLKQMGVASLKIEGRMKRPEYVAAAVSAFRYAADGLDVPDDIRQLLGSVFSRSGHTDGYFKNKPGAGMFGRRTDEAKDEAGATFGQLHSLYRTERQSLPIDLSLKLAEGVATMTVVYGEHRVRDSSTAQEAVKMPLDCERARALCGKLGNTPFYLNNFNFENNGQLTLPAAAVNALRRNCCDRLFEAMSANRVECCNIDIQKPKQRQNKKAAIYVRLDSADQLPQNLSLADRVYLPLGSRLPDHPNVGVELPRAMLDGEETVKRQLTDALSQGAKYALCHNLASVELAKNAGLKVHLGFGINVFNSVAAQSLKADDITLSFELTLKQAQSVGVGGIIAYGRLPLMLTRNCPLGGKKHCGSCKQSLVDRVGATFPIRCRGGYSEIFNSKPLMLSSGRDDIDNFDFLTLYFTDESAEKCEQIIACYKNGMALEGDFTRGLYYRGVE